MHLACRANCSRERLSLNDDVCVLKSRVSKIKLVQDVREKDQTKQHGYEPDDKEKFCPGVIVDFRYLEVKCFSGLFR